jgi:hypothetical protein
VTTASRIDQVLPQASSAQLLGVQTQAGGIEYQLGRKLYFNSIIGFGNIIGAGDTADNASTGAELTLAEFESTGPNDINPVLADVGFFTTGSLAAALSNSSGTLTGGAANTPFCEDFNQTIVCVQAATVTTTNGSTAITFSANTTLSATALLSFSNQSGVQYGLASAITASTTGTLATAYTGTGGAKQSYSLAPTNDNACFRNPAGVVNDNSGTATTQTGAPTGAASAAANANVNSTVCGNGVQDAFEECDNGTANGTSGNPCSVACRCAGRNSYEPGGIAPTGGYACQ